MWSISKFKTISDHFTHNDMILRLYVEFDEMSDLQPLCATMESFGLQVLDTTLNHSKRSGDYNAIMAIKNPEGQNPGGGDRIPEEDSGSPQGKDDLLRYDIFQKSVMFS